MSADEFLKKWGFLPPIKYENPTCWINAYYGTHVIIRDSRYLDSLLTYIDEKLEGFQK
jgi:hypothetical protein